MVSHSVETAGSALASMEMRLGKRHLAAWGTRRKGWKFRPVRSLPKLIWDAAGPIKAPGLSVCGAV